MTAASHRSLVELLRFRAQVQKDQRAYVFLADGETETAHVTYGELDRTARAIAASLQAVCRPGDRALLLYPAGLDFIRAFLGCLYAGVVAVPSHPVPPARPERGAPRVLAIARDATPAVVLTTAALAAGASRIGPLQPELPRARWLATDTIAPASAEAWAEPSVQPETLAFLQYTSGSTGAPKGVMVTHGNLLHNLAGGAARAADHAESVGVSWLPFYHDMGLIEGILHPAYSGYPAYLMAPSAFLQRPVRWLELIARVRGTTSGGPNFAYDLCVRRLSPDERDALNLSSWRIAYCGAEPIRAESLAAFASAFAGSGFRAEAFYPSYGLAEATLVATTKASGTRVTTRTVDAAALGCDRVLLAAPRGRFATLVGCGTPLAGTRLLIVDPDTHAPCPGSTVGEIWLAGGSIARGYWNRPDETERTFGARVAPTGDGPFLRTGDLGFVADGGLFVTGRIKDVIIVRGRKHYPQDLELTVERSHTLVRPGGCVAFPLDGVDGERVGIVIEIDLRHARGAERDTVEPAVADAVIDAIRRAITETHELAVALVALLPPGGLPKTSSGKLRRSQCRTALLDGRLEVLARWEDPRR